MGKPGEQHVDLSPEQWATVQAALDGEIAELKDALAAETQRAEEAEREREDLLQILGATAGERNQAQSRLATAEEALREIRRVLIETTHSAVVLNEEIRAAELLASEGKTPITIDTRMQVLDNRREYITRRTSDCIAALSKESARAVVEES